MELGLLLGPFGRQGLKMSKILSLTQSEDYLQNPQKQTKVKEYEREIDQLVYKLYGLTEEEIMIVEGIK